LSDLLLNCDAATRYRYMSAHENPSRNRFAHEVLRIFLQCVGATNYPHRRVLGSQAHIGTRPAGTLFIPAQHYDLIQAISEAPPFEGFDVILVKRFAALTLRILDPSRKVDPAKIAFTIQNNREDVEFSYPGVEAPITLKLRKSPDGVRARGEVLDEISDKDPTRLDAFRAPPPDEIQQDLIALMASEKVRSTNQLKAQVGYEAYVKAGRTREAESLVFGFNFERHRFLQSLDPRAIKNLKVTRCLVIGLSTECFVNFETPEGSRGVGVVRFPHQASQQPADQDSIAPTLNIYPRANFLKAGMPNLLKSRVNHDLKQLMATEVVQKRTKEISEGINPNLRTALSGISDIKFTDIDYDAKGPFVAISVTAEVGAMSWSSIQSLGVPRNANYMRTTETRRFLYAVVPVEFSRNGGYFDLIETSNPCENLLVGVDLLSTSL
jgi:hypothetical protein